jgi:hypothetical protein
MFTYLALVSPPVALAIDVFARSIAEIGRADDEDLEALRPGLVPSPRTGRDAHRVPFLELDDLVVDLHPPAPAQDHVHLLLFLVRVAVWKAIAGRDSLVAQAGFLELKRLGRQAELQVRRAVKPGPEVLQVLLEVPERERQGAILWHPDWGRRSNASSAAVPGSFPAALRGQTVGTASHALQEGLVPEHRASPSREKRPSSYKGGPALAGITGAWRDRTVLITRMNTPAHSKYRKADTGLDRLFCFRVQKSRIDWVARFRRDLNVPIAG